MIAPFDKLLNFLCVRKMYLLAPELISTVSFGGLNPFIQNSRRSIVDLQSFLD
jgi:hypothetical protein